MRGNASLRKKINTAPLSSGCYLFKDALGSVIYVGKAVVIRKRVKQYFQKLQSLDTKTRQLVMHTFDAEFVTTDSDLEALILETNLIKKYKPRFNVMLKDDKSYAFLEITDDEFPRISIVRKIRGKKNTYFGPFPSPVPLKRALKRLRRIYPYRSCNRDMREVNKDGKVKIQCSDPKPCLYYHLHLCEAPCANLTTKKDYRTHINAIKRFFRGEKHILIAEMEKQMHKLSDMKDYEQAAMIRDRVHDLTYIASNIKVEKDMDEDEWKAKQMSSSKSSLAKLVEQLGFEDFSMKDNFKVECYDVSNIQGKHATASMVVFVDGLPKKDLYRKFKIRLKDTPDDFAMMREVFTRRFGDKEKHTDDESFSTLADLIVVDGGKGQLSAVYQTLRDQGFEVPVIGLAKRQEEVFKLVEVNGELEFKKVRVSNRSPGSYVLQRIRDEAHRFALKYHRTLRAGAMVHSALDDIPGVGKLTRTRLIKEFGSLSEIKKAPKKRLLEVIKNKTTVENIKRLL